MIGTIDETLSPLTIGANGVRVYSALSHAIIFDAYPKSQDRNVSITTANKAVFAQIYLSKFIWTNQE